MARLNARPLSADAEFPLFAFSATGYPNFALGLIHVFNGVGKQVLKYLLDAGSAPRLPVGKGFSTLIVTFVGGADELNYLMHHLVNVHPDQIFSNTPYT